MVRRSLNILSILQLMETPFEKRQSKILFDKSGQACPGLKLDLRQEGLEVFLYSW